MLNRLQMCEFVRVEQFAILKTMMIRIGMYSVPLKRRNSKRRYLKEQFLIHKASFVLSFYAL